MTVAGLTNTIASRQCGHNRLKPDPEQAVDREQSELTQSLAAQNVQLVTQGEVLQFRNRPPPDSAEKQRGEGTLGNARA